MAQIEIKGIIGEDYKMSNLLTDFASCGVEPIRLLIASQGGNFFEGMDMSNFIKSKQDRFLSVSNSGDVASIAMPIFVSLPREKRFFDLSKGVPLIHNPYLDPFSLAFMDTTAEGLSLISSELETVETDYAKWMQANTGADIDVIRGLMKINQPLTEEQMVALDIATIYKYQAVAIFKPKNEMNTEDVKQIIAEDRHTFLDEIKGWFKKTTKFVAIMLTDAVGNQLEFPDVMEGTEPIVGDTARFADGSLPNGEVLMADGTIYEFENGKLMEIKAAEPTPEPVTEPAPDALQAVQAELEATKAELANFKAQATQKETEIKTLRSQIKSQMPTTTPESTPEPIDNSGKSAFAIAAEKIKQQVKN